MKNLLKCFVISLCLMISTAYAEPITTDFMGQMFFLYRVEKERFYDIVNYYSSKNFEKDGQNAVVIMSYIKTDIPIRRIFDSVYKNKHSSGVLQNGTKKFADDRIAFSYMEKVGKNNVYTIFKIQENLISGVDILEFHIPIAEKLSIKTLDLKYFKSFFNKNADIFYGQKGVTYPSTYPLKYNGKTFYLKYSSNYGGDYTNRYLKKNDKFMKHNECIRINYLRTKMKPEDMVEQIIKVKGHTKGFKQNQNEKYGDSQIFSYFNNVVDLTRNKKYVNYSVFKIEPDKRGLRTIEYYTFIPKTENMQNVMAETEKKNREYIKTYKIPELVKEVLGSIPDWKEYPYQEIEVGVRY